ncbi:Nn.00g005530.m01.CDS01 [Neocucurbitaria sp. VM-36]
MEELILKEALRRVWNNMGSDAGDTSSNIWEYDRLAVENEQITNKALSDEAVYSHRNLNPGLHAPVLESPSTLEDRRLASENERSANNSLSQEAVNNQRYLNPGLYAPVIGADPPSSNVVNISDMLRRLEDPTRIQLPNGNSAFVLTNTWAISVIGPERFFLASPDGRRWINQQDPILTNGETHQLARNICQWLKSKEDELCVDVVDFDDFFKAANQIN